MHAKILYCLYADNQSKWSVTLLSYFSGSVRLNDGLPPLRSWIRALYHWIDTQPKVQLRQFSSFFTAVILLANGFGFTSFCLWRLELSQSTLINCPISKVNNGLLFFVKTTKLLGKWRRPNWNTKLDFWLSIYSGPVPNIWSYVENVCQHSTESREFSPVHIQSYRLQ